MVAYGLLCAGPPDTMMGIRFRQGWLGPTCFPMCAVTRAGARDTLCTCPERGATGAAGVGGTAGERGSTWRIWRTRRAWHAHLSPVSRTDR
eukprot:9492039-Pyramimonas_sp.AAC.1